MLKIIIAIALLQLSQISQAACDGLADKVSSELHYPDSASAEGRFFSDCKIWPIDSSQTIVVLAHFQKGSSFTSPESNMGLYDLDILLVKTKSARVVSRLFQKGALSSDSVGLDRIAIDTARYNLAPNVRAFGIRVHYAHPKRYYPHEFEDLNLYVINGEEISLVLDKLGTIDSGGEVGECDGFFSDTRRTLAIGKTTSHGYADLVVTTKTIDSETKILNGECVEVKQQPSVTQDTLQFDGKAYPHVVQ